MFEEFFKNYDSSYELVFHANWIDWEEHGWIFIFQKEKKFYVLEGGYCIMDIFHRETTWENLQVITQIEALQEMINWQEYECVAEW